MLKYDRMHKKISSWVVCGYHGACLNCMLPGVEVTTGLLFLCVQVIYVIMKIVIPRFNRPNLLSRFLVGWNSNNSSLKQLCNTDKKCCY